MNHRPLATICGATTPAVTYQLSVGWQGIPEATAKTETATGVLSLPRDRIRVVVVDDAPALRGAMHDLLEDMGFDVVGMAADGASGVDTARRLEPDVVLMDLRMAGLDGLQATRIIRRELPNIQVVVISAYDDRSLRLEARRAGAFAYLLKGSSADRIESVISDAALVPKLLTADGVSPVDAAPPCSADVPAHGSVLDLVCVAGPEATKASVNIGA